MDSRSDTIGKEKETPNAAERSPPVDIFPGGSGIVICGPKLLKGKSLTEVGPPKKNLSSINESVF